jgi:RNA polymerase sigma-B factor
MADATRQPEEGQAMVLANLALAERVARHFFRRGSRHDDDLVQVGFIGLVKAAQRFEPERGTDFAAYAVPTISGEIKRHLRDHGWFVRPPRRVQDLQVRINQATPRLTQSLRHRPSVAELAAALFEQPEDIREAIAAAGHMQPVSLDAGVGDGSGATLGDHIPAPAHDMERAELCLLLRGALARLSPRDRRVVLLRFFDDRTQHDIASELGVTQMQVSRILARILRTLRDDLEGADTVDRSGA